MTFRLTRRIGVATAAAAMAIAGVAAIPSAQAAEAVPFYSTPATLPGANGDIVRSEPSIFYLDPIKLIKIDANVQRIMYRTTDRLGKAIAVTGTVIVPKSPWVGIGQRPIVGYAAGTQGVGDHCAPSRQLTVGTEYEGPFVSGLIARGYAVAMTDYQGLGTDGDHTYMNRIVQGTAVLDSIRAAQRLPGTGLPTGGPVAIHGYSQGGGAAAAAAELAPTYAPELKLKGVSAGAVPADLFDVAKNLDGGLYAAFLGYATVGLTSGYGYDPTPLLNATGAKFFNEVKEHCTLQALPRFAFQKSASLTADGKSIPEVLNSNQQLSNMVAEQRIGKVKPTVPILISHSALDDAIPYATGKQLARDWCAKGADVRFAPNLGPTHVGGAIASYPGAFAWLEARFAGLPTISNCWVVPFL
ncbi:Triacylglycerol lipase precursor [Alloactinosynnema sp. L-07]|uniref:lipase family protein n=1 Tax=Alloactinosynnema sp. L-07 TaxID=1653480 RepID=UPI00065EF883|nr:lipase family protein [Alloactinosynnema sp. L-07]CRK58790.1 Triacylglycerol lipase precursor [Alloactinosynnema sp. L-07]